MNRRVDAWLISVVIMLIVLGLVMVYSASAVVMGEQSKEMMFFVRQLIAVVIGLGLCAATAVTPTGALRKYRKHLYVLTLLGLLLCMVPGIQHKANGAARWFGFGGANIQPSEFAKITVLIMLAHYLHKRRAWLHDMRVVARGLLIPLPILFLVLIQPDFGTTVIIGGLCAIMLFVAGARLVHMGSAVLCSVVIGVPLLVLEQYRLQRITSFLRPWETMNAEGYHIIQSWIAIHSGGLWGQGLGNSISKLHFLPEPWTDFIGSVIAEELGLVRLLCVICLYGLLVWRGLVIARNARDAFGSYLAATLTAMIGWEAFFNLAVVMGMVPPKGLVLPFLSYGASAMISHLWAVGILLSVAAESEPVPLTEGWLRGRKNIRTQSAA
jgi:cell division protein FtsW